MQSRAHYNILWILTVEENAGKAVVENLALSWALLLRPLLLGVTLLEGSRVNLIRQDRLHHLLQTTKCEESNFGIPGVCWQTSSPL